MIEYEDRKYLASGTPDRKRLVVEGRLHLFHDVFRHGISCGASCCREGLSEGDDRVIT